MLAYARFGMGRALLVLLVTALLVMPTWFVSLSYPTLPPSQAMRVQVRRGAGIVSVPLERYVAGVVLQEMPAFSPKAALEAQAIAARTYGLYLMNKSGVIGDTDRAQIYRPFTLNRPGAARVAQAVADTRGEIIAYQGQPILAAYSAAAGPRTESSANAWGDPQPYLRVQSDPFDRGSSLYRRAIVMKADTVRQRLGSATMRVVARDAAGHVVKVYVGRRLWTGAAVVARLGLPSADFWPTRQGSKVLLQVYGDGHGVGLDQAGAETMARLGYSAAEILAFYYPGTKIKQLAD